DPGLGTRAHAGRGVSLTKGAIVRRPGRPLLGARPQARRIEKECAPATAWTVPPCATVTSWSRVNGTSWKWKAAQVVDSVTPSEGGARNSCNGTYKMWLWAAHSPSLELREEVTARLSGGAMSSAEPSPVTGRIWTETAVQAKSLRNRRLCIGAAPRSSGDDRGPGFVARWSLAPVEVHGERSDPDPGSHQKGQRDRVAA